MCSGLTARTLPSSRPISHIRQRSPPPSDPRTAVDRHRTTRSDRRPIRTRATAPPRPEGDPRPDARPKPGRMGQSRRSAAAMPPHQACRGSCVATSGTSTQTPPDAEPEPPAEHSAKPSTTVPHRARDAVMGRPHERGSRAPACAFIPRMNVFPHPRALPKPAVNTFRHSWLA